MTAWVPDAHLLDSARCGKLDAKTLNTADRSWVVAGLAANGFTADTTAKLLKCSLRLIRQIRAEPMTVVCTYAMNLNVELERANQRTRSAEVKARVDIDAANRDRDRYKTQLDQWIAAQQSRRARA